LCSGRLTTIDDSLRRRGHWSAWGWIAVITDAPDVILSALARLASLEWRLAFLSQRLGGLFISTAIKGTHRKSLRAADTSAGFQGGFCNDTDLFVVRRRGGRSGERARRAGTDRDSILARPQWAATWARRSTSSLARGLQQVSERSNKGCGSPPGVNKGSYTEALTAGDSPPSGPSRRLTSCRSSRSAPPT
jgi:hypothetical protein